MENVETELSQVEELEKKASEVVQNIENFENINAGNLSKLDTLIKNYVSLKKDFNNHQGHSSYSSQLSMAKRELDTVYNEIMSAFKNILSVSNELYLVDWNINLTKQLNSGEDVDKSFTGIAYKQFPLNNDIFSYYTEDGIRKLLSKAKQFCKESFNSEVFESLKKVAKENDAEELKEQKAGDNLSSLFNNESEKGKDSTKKQMN